LLFFSAPFGPEVVTETSTVPLLSVLFGVLQLFGLLPWQTKLVDDVENPGGPAFAGPEGSPTLASPTLPIATAPTLATPPRLPFLLLPFASLLPISSFGDPCWVRSAVYRGSWALIEMLCWPLIGDSARLVRRRSCAAARRRCMKHRSSIPPPAKTRGSRCPATRRSLDVCEVDHQPFLRAQMRSCWYCAAVFDVSGG
jgi:hypothetical protein